MTIKPEDFAASQKTSVETFFAITNKAFESIVKLTDLNIATAKDTLAQAADLSDQILSAKDAQSLMGIVNSVAQPSAEKALTYSKKVYEIASKTQAELSKFAEAQIEHNNKQVAQLLDSAAKNAPQGSEAVVSMMKSAVANANSAYDSLTKAAKQAVEMAESNVNNAVKASTAKAK